MSAAAAHDRGPPAAWPAPVCRLAAGGPPVSTSNTTRATTPRRAAGRARRPREQSGLRGRGGGSFPTGRKLEAVAARGQEDRRRQRGRGRAGERQGPQARPPSAAPRVRRSRARGRGGRRRKAIVAVGGASELELAALAGALDFRARRRLDRRVELAAVAAPRWFVAGEEAALVRFLEGGPARPTFAPRPYESGVGRSSSSRTPRRRHLALIARFGPGGSVSSALPTSPGRSW